MRRRGIVEVVEVRNTTRSKSKCAGASLFPAALAVLGYTSVILVLHPTSAHQRSYTNFPTPSPIIAKGTSPNNKSLINASPKECRHVLFRLNSHVENAKSAKTLGAFHTGCCSILGEHKFGNMSLLCPALTSCTDDRSNHDPGILHIWTLKTSLEDDIKAQRP